jgi:hypothetical protein
VVRGPQFEKLWCKGKGKVLSEEQWGRYIILYRKINEEILEELKVEPVDEKLRTYKSYLITTCKKNEQQQDVRNEAEI